MSFSFSEFASSIFSFKGTQKTKLNEINAAFDVVVNWFNNNVGHYEYTEDDREIEDALENVSTLALRLNKKVAVKHTEELGIDMIHTMYSHYILTYLIARDQGFKPTASEKVAHPLLRESSELSGKQLVMEYKEAINQIDYLLDKYPH